MIREGNQRLHWQSKLILLVVVPWTAISVVLQSYFGLGRSPIVALTTLGVSGVFGVIVWRMRAGTPAAAATGSLICASLMFSTAGIGAPYIELAPLLTVFVLTYAATKVGNAKKERLGVAEERRGRNAAQVAANLGIAPLVAMAGSLGALSNWISDSSSVTVRTKLGLAVILSHMIAVAALAEAAADTVSSEVGQVFGGEPRLITTWRRVPIGTDGGVTAIGTGAGALAAVVVAAISTFVFTGGEVLLSKERSGREFAMLASGGIFGLVFDSILGQTLERKGLLNNDAVNFLSTLSAVIVVIAEIWIFGFPIEG
jgi:uncharacterized membrane protein